MMLRITGATQSCYLGSTDTTRESKQESYPREGCVATDHPLQVLMR